LKTASNVFVVAAVAAASIAAAACSSGSGSRSTTPAAGSATAAAADASPAAVSSPPASSAPTPVDASSVQLEPVTGEFGSYTIQIPQGWQTEDLRLPGGFGTRHMLMDGGFPAVQVTVRCDVDGTIDTMMWQDEQIISHLKSDYNPAGAKDIDVNGLPGKQVDYSLGLAGTVNEQRAVYVVSAPCGWRIILQTFVAGNRAAFGPLFARIVRTFEPRPFTVPFTDRDPYQPFPSPTPAPGP
jgi:hypothetical protein